MLRVFLFGKFRARDDKASVDSLASKVRELFCYLLLHRSHPHSREALATLLWGCCSTAQSKAYLRKALWQLQHALKEQDGPDAQPVLLIEPEWVHLNPSADLWLDVAAFEQAYAQVRGVSGAVIDANTAYALEQGVALYESDLLENWYQDWCLLERERLQHLYLSMLDKLVSYCEVHRKYDAGLEYGGRILIIDPAREHTHQWLMRLRYLTGDRTGALRQYQRCTEALEEELGVGPSQRTQQLYELIRTDRLEVLLEGEPPAADDLLSVPFLERLKLLQSELFRIQNQIQQEIEAVKVALQRNS